jgi:hypothetical protein
MSKQLRPKRLKRLPKLNFYIKIKNKMRASGGFDCIVEAEFEAILLAIPRSA